MKNELDEIKTEDVEWFMKECEEQTQENIDLIKEFDECIEKCDDDVSKKEYLENYRTKLIDNVNSYKEIIEECKQLYGL